MVIDTTHLTGKSLRSGRFKIGQFLSSGGFGSVHLGEDTKKGVKAVIKFEAADYPHKTLQLEFRYYKILNQGSNVPNFIPKVFYFGYHKDNARDLLYLAMELGGPSLSDMMKKLGGSFSITTTTQLLEQLVNIMEYLHDRKVLYRDIKPGNFLIGLPNTERWCTVLVIDMGLAKDLVDSDGNHIPFREGKPLAGTLHFASANNLQCKEISRRDDMEALLYMAMHMFGIPLVWLNVGVEWKEEDPLRMNRLQGEFKAKMNPVEMCQGMPSQYATFLTIVRNLEFEERPPYRKLVGLMRDVLVTLGIYPEEKFYDWDEAHNPIKESLRQ